MGRFHVISALANRLFLTRGLNTLQNTYVQSYTLSLLQTIHCKKCERHTFFFNHCSTLSQKRKERCASRRSSNHSQTLGGASPLSSLNDRK